MSKSLVSDIQAAFAPPKPRSQRLLEEAAVAIKHEVLNVVEMLITRTRVDVYRELEGRRVSSATLAAVMDLFEKLETDIEGL